jgi:hypothetical protein
VLALRLLGVIQNALSAHVQGNYVKILQRFEKVSYMLPTAKASRRSEHQAQHLKDMLATRMKILVE